MQPITSIATSLLNFGIFALLVRYWSSVDDFPLNKSIGARLLNLSIGFRDLNIWSPVFRRRGVILKTGHPNGLLFPLLIGIDGTFIFRSYFFSIPPLPVVVAVVVDLLDRDRRLRRDIIGEVIGSLVDPVFLLRLGKAGLALAMLGEVLGIVGNVSEQLGRIVVERVDDVGGEVRWGRRWLVGHGPICVNQQRRKPHSFVG